MDNLRIRLRVPIPVLEALQALAEQRKISVTEVLRQAISTESYFDKAIAEGRKVFTEFNGEFKQVSFPYLENKQEN